VELRRREQRGYVEIRPEVLQAVIDRPGSTIEEIIDAVTAAMEPDGMDIAPYPSRHPHEARFRQKVRKCLRDVQPLIANGLVEYEGEKGGGGTTLARASCGPEGD